MAGSKKIPNVPSDADESWYELVKNPKDFKRLVPAYGGVDPEEAFKRAERIMDELASEYFDKLGSDIKELEGLISKFSKDRDPAHLDEVFKLVHNMRGQGTTFDFPLVTAVGASFCNYSANRVDKNRYSFELIIQHLEALKVIYRENLQGEGNQLARTVVAALQQAVSLELEREKSTIN